MTPQLVRVGASQSPVVIVDGLTDAWQMVAEVAEHMAPFPASVGNYYPGVRRVIGPADGAANAYVDSLLRVVAPFIGGAFEVDHFDLLEASFSMVTRRPETLEPAQRMPHFDSTDPNYIAVLHYLSDTPRTGTAFYRQRSTGIETVDQANLTSFVERAKTEGAEPGYVNGSNPHFEQIHAVEGLPGRVLIYRGCLLHSGMIPPDMDFRANPRQGRLTANLFIQGHQQ